MPRSRGLGARRRAFKRLGPSISWSEVKGYDPRAKRLTRPLDAWRAAQRVKRPM